MFMNDCRASLPKVVKVNSSFHITNLLYVLNIYGSFRRAPGCFEVSVPLLSFARRNTFASIFLFAPI